MHPEDKILDMRVGYYHAPGTCSQVNPSTIPPEFECVELITAGGVFHDDGSGEKYYPSGTIFWHFPDDQTVHKYLQDRPYECFVAYFRIEGEHRRIGPRVTSWNLSSDLLKFSDESLRAYHDDTFNRAVLARAVHSRLLLAAYTSEHKTVLQGTPRVVERAVSMIEKSFSNNMSVETLASELGVSVPHLHMLFKKYLGESPHQRILSRRLQEAKNLLASTGMSLKTLAFDCGFPSVEHFCRLFKQRFGMTPSDYRKKCEPYAELRSRPRTAATKCRNEDCCTADYCPS